MIIDVKMRCEATFTTPGAEMNEFTSLAYHWLRYSVQRTRTPFEQSMFIISIDIDVGCRELGTINQGKYDTDVNLYVSEYQIGVIEELALPLFIRVFDEYALPVTFAIRGQLTALEGALRPFHGDAVEHDLGAHGYYHREFPTLTPREAEDELRMIAAGMRKFGVTPRSFVYPRNAVAHLDLLEKYGYKCYRGHGDFRSDCMRIDREGALYNIHPSLYLMRGLGHAPWLLGNILDIAVTRKLPLHLWFHLWNFGSEANDIQRGIDTVLVPLLQRAKRYEERGTLTFETMLSAAVRAEEIAEHAG